MKLTKTKLMIMSLVATIIMLSGCVGDDGIEGSGEKPTTKLSGTAATGAPLANKQIRFRAINGAIHTTTTDADGKYAIEIVDDKGPFLMEVVGNDARPLYSVAFSSGTANIHPLTDLVMRNWYSVKGHDIEYEFNRADSAAFLPKSQDIANTEAAFRSILQTGMGEYGVADLFDFFTTPFVADSLGMDQYLDQLRVSTKYSKINVSLKLNTFGSEANIIVNVDLSTDFTVVDTQAPTDPNSLQILQGSSGLVVVWNEASDNRGVAGYHVFRDGTQIATTTFPLYSDVGLPQPEPINGYCYQVQAFDGAGLTSNKVPLTPACSKGPTVVDVTPPLKPATPTIVSQASQSVGISWLPTLDDTGAGVLGYDVYRGSNVSEGLLIATTVASEYLDLLASNVVNECYRIRAFDASRNTSVFSDPVCVAAPTIDNSAPITIASPAASTYNAAIEVRLTCDDGIGDSGCNGTYYSFDTSNNPSWILYTQPLTISVSSTLRYYSIDNAGNTEVAKSASYIINSGSTTLSGINFVASNFSANEDIGGLLVNVSRTGDLATSVSVDYAVVPGGTATAGVDFESVSGTLTWAANEGGNKSFILPILADNVTDPNETVFLSLLNPSQGASVGAQSDAVVTINDITCANLYDYIGSTTIDTDTTLSGCWLVNNYFYINAPSGQAAALLSIQPGTTMLFGNSAGFNIQGNGAMSALGAADKPILFSGSVKAENAWKGVQYTFSADARNELAHVVIEYAGISVNGSANLMVFGQGTQLKVRDSVLRNSGSYGFDFSDSVVISEFARNTMVGNLSGPGRLYSTNVHQIDAASHYNGNGDGSDFNYLHVLPNNTPTGNITWPTVDVPYFIDGYLYVGSNLNLSPGSVFLFDTNGGINVQTAGSLSAIGTNAEKIRFTRRYAINNSWRGIQYTFTNSGNNKLDHVIVEYGSGGSGTNGFAGVMVFGQGAQLSINNSTISDSVNFGVSFETDAVIPSFSNNIVVRNAQPVSLPANLVDRLEDHNTATGNDFSGNTLDIIEVASQDIVKPEGTLWPNVGVPYRLTGRVYFYAPVVIEAGVTMYMSANASIWVGSSSASVGRIVANGSAAQPITITSANVLNPLLGATAGDWQGIEFASSTNNSFNYVSVSYGGALGLNASANVVLINNSTLTIHNSTISDSSGYGIWSNSTSSVTGVLASDGVTVNPDIIFSNNASGDFFQQ